jgi:hypothetical protein
MARQKIFIGVAVIAVLATALAVLFFFAPDQYSFYPQCLLHRWTGWQCPGCGGLRAAHRLLHGDFRGAFRLNGLLMALLPFLAAFTMASTAQWLTGRDCLERVRGTFWWWLLLAAVVVFGVARNLPR